jgi:hypothetical protein
VTSLFGNYAPNTLEPARPAWEAAALCRAPGADPRWWDADSIATPDGAHAAAWCWRCPSRIACLDAALAAERSTGPEHRGAIYGGLDGRQRHALHRSRTRNAQRRRAREAVMPP